MKRILLIRAGLFAIIHLPTACTLGIKPNSDSYPVLKQPLKFELLASMPIKMAKKGDLLTLRYSIVNGHVSGIENLQVSVAIDGGSILETEKTKISHNIDGNGGKIEGQAMVRMIKNRSRIVFHYKAYYYLERLEIDGEPDIILGSGQQ